MKMNIIVECGYQEPPAPTPVSIHYTLKDIDELEQVGRNQTRRRPRGPKNFINQVQIFRSIGGYLDKNEAKLFA